MEGSFNGHQVAELWNEPLVPGLGQNLRAAGSCLVLRHIVPLSLRSVFHEDGMTGAGAAGGCWRNLIQCALENHAEDVSHE